MNLIRALLLIIAVGLTAACGPPADAEPAPPADAEPAPPAELPLTLSISGGIAGLSDTLDVDTAGRWTLTDGKGNRPPSTGQLTGGELTELRRLLADPELVDVPEDGSRQCADYFRYSLVTQARTVGNGPCGEASPAFEDLIDYLSEVTGM